MKVPRNLSFFFIIRPTLLRESFIFVWEKKTQWDRPDAGSQSYVRAIREGLASGQLTLTDRQVRIAHDLRDAFQKRHFRGKPGAHVWIDDSGGENYAPPKLLTPRNPTSAEIKSAKHKVLRRWVKRYRTEENYCRANLSTADLQAWCLQFFAKK